MPSLSVALGILAVLLGACQGQNTSDLYGVVQSMFLCFSVARRGRASFSVSGYVWTGHRSLVHHLTVIKSSWSSRDPARLVLQAHLSRTL